MASYKFRTRRERMREMRENSEDFRCEYAHKIRTEDGPSSLFIDIEAPTKNEYKEKIADSNKKLADINKNLTKSKEEIFFYFVDDCVAFEDDVYVSVDEVLKMYRNTADSKRYPGLTLKKKAVIRVITKKYPAVYLETKMGKQVFVNMTWKKE